MTALLLDGDPSCMATLLLLDAALFSRRAEGTLATGDDSESGEETPRISSLQVRSIPPSPPTAASCTR